MGPDILPHIIHTLGTTPHTVIKQKTTTYILLGQELCYPVQLKGRSPSQEKLFIDQEVLWRDSQFAQVPCLLRSWQTVLRTSARRDSCCFCVTTRFGWSTLGNIKAKALSCSSNLEDQCGPSKPFKSHLHVSDLQVWTGVQAEHQTFNLHQPCIRSEGQTPV